MSDIDFDSEIELALNYGLVNDFAASKLADMSKDGITEDLWQKTLEHYTQATSAGVKSDKDLSAFFYIDLFADDLLKKSLGTKLSGDELDSFKRFLFENRGDLNLISIESFREAVKAWVKQQEAAVKLAHPNTGHVPPPAPQYNLNAWTTLFIQAQNMVRTGVRADVALGKVSTSLSVPEKYKFLLWAKNNLSGEYSKYNINHRIQNMNAELRKGKRAMKTKIASDGHYYYIPKLLPPAPAEPESKALVFEPSDYDDQYAIDFETARNKLMSRVFAIDKLLEKYRRVLKAEQMDAVEEALEDLRKKIRKLRLAASVRDSIIKTANILKKLEFDQGSDALIAIAAEPVDAAPVTKVVQKEFDVVPPEQREAALDDAISKLTNISAVIKNRDVVRSLAEIDLMLHRLRMSSFFPEIQEAQSKLIDAYGYASNKLDDLLPKLRGGLQTQPEIISTESPPEAEPQSTDKKQLGEEVNELSTELREPPPPRPKAQPQPKEKQVAPAPPAEDEGFEDEPVSLKAVPGLE